MSRHTPQAATAFESAVQSLDVSAAFLERLVTAGRIRPAGDGLVAADDVRRFAEHRALRRQAADEAVEALLDAGVEY